MGVGCSTFLQVPQCFPGGGLEDRGGGDARLQWFGMSVMEMSHRSATFKGIIETAGADIRDLMSIPDNYRVLFWQGGATPAVRGTP